MNLKRIFALCAAVLGALLFMAAPAWAVDASQILVTSCTPIKGGIDLCPLVPVINGFITAAASLLLAAVPVFVGLLAKWLYSHGVNMSQQAQKVVSDRISATIQNGLKYAVSGADVGIQRITIPVQNDAVRTAANYAIAQSPDLLKRAGINVTTVAGQEALVRRITAEAQPTPPAMEPSSRVEVNSPAPPAVGG